MEQRKLYRTGEQYFYAEETKSDALRLLRCYGDLPVVSVPSLLEGRRVTELGDYCFSDSVKGERTGEQLPEGTRELSGRYLRRVILPDSVRRLGDFCFYNCSCLEELALGAAVEEIGSDAFMNCMKLRVFRLRCGMEDRSGLKQLLGQRMSDTTVLFERQEDGSSTDSAAELVGELFYPEYYEQHQEIGPAHIFAMSIQGEGFRARQCFRDGVLSLRDYDEIFEQACAEESAGTLCRMALNRLYYPVSLEREAEERYTVYLQRQEQTLVKYLIRERALDKLEYFVQREIISEKGLGEGIRLAAEQEWTEGAAELLRLQQEKKKSAAQERYAFDFF